MAVNVRDEEVIRLAHELIHRLHLTSRVDALLDVLGDEVWPALGAPITKAERG